MSESNGNSKGPTTRWEGYSDYKNISQRVSQSVADALDAYAFIQSTQTEGETLKPHLAANARADIMAASMRLYVEMKQEQSEGVDEYDEILERWTGEEGFITRYQAVQLSNEIPGWMYQFVLDIRQAAWSLGYLQAGRRSREDPDDPVEADARAMFENM